jgi:hypothetical protein
MNEETPAETRQSAFGFAGAAKAVLWGIGIMALIIVLAWAALVIWGRVVFGPPIHAVDGDPHLTAIAKSALPLIRNLDRYYGEHRHYPKETANIESTLGPTDSNGLFGGWYYIAEADDAYSLYFKLGWDPSLFYRCTKDGTYWEFDPGDGAPSKILHLKP